MKFDMCVKRIRICNPTIIFSKHVVVLIFLRGVVSLGYNQVCNQILSPKKHVYCLTKLDYKFPFKKKKIRLKVFASKGGKKTLFTN